MANTQRITRIPRKPTVRVRLVTGRNRLVTIAFKRTFLDGPMDGASVYIRRRTSRAKARRLIAAGSSFIGMDGETGSPIVDLFIHECLPDDVGSLSIERNALIRENAILAKAIERRSSEGG